MANNHNLKPWPKGTSGNPAGRPSRGKAFSELIQLIEDTPGAERELSKVWLKEMLKGNLGFFREYLDRRDGKVAKPVQAAEAATIDWSALNVTCDTVRPGTIKQ